MITLPTGVVKATQKNPRTTLIYTKPKQGKTTILSILSLLYNGLVVDTEKGSDFVDAIKVQVNNYEELREVAKAIYAAGYKDGKYTPPYKYLILDTLTRVDEWSEIVGTFNYMNKPQGKSFNRVGGKKDGVVLPVNDPEFETVHEIGQGFGYRYSREAVLKFFENFNQLAPHIIYVCHVKDKYVGTTSSGDGIASREINLTGKLKDILSSKVDIIAYGYREGNKLILSFADDEGSRCPHLSGKKITVSESDDTGKVVTYWEKIFLPE